MKNKVFTSFIITLFVVAATLFAFQNCSEPDNGGGNSAYLPSGSNGPVPGAAGSTADLNNTGLSQPAPQPTLGPGPQVPATFITILYQGVIQRSPTSQELASWGQYVSLGYGCTFIVQNVMGSAEYVALLGRITNVTAVNDVYKGLLNRLPSSSELSASDFAGAASSSASHAASVIIPSTEFQTYCSQFGNLKP